MKIILNSLEKDLLYKWSKSAEMYVANPTIVKVLYNPKYETTLIKILDFYIQLQDKTINKTK